VALLVGFTSVTVKLQTGETKMTSAKNGNNRLTVFFMPISSFLLNNDTDNASEGYSSYEFSGKNSFVFVVNRDCSSSIPAGTAA
jgi:hypothetical protein